MAAFFLLLPPCVGTATSSIFALISPSFKSDSRGLGDRGDRDDSDFMGGGESDLKSWSAEDEKGRGEGRLASSRKGSSLTPDISSYLSIDWALSAWSAHLKG